MCEVGQAVPVEVARGHGGGRASYDETLLVYERSIAETQQHRHVVKELIGGSQIGQAIAVEVARGHGDRTKTHAKALLGCERAVAETQQHRHVVTELIGGSQIGSGRPR